MTDRALQASPLERSPAENAPPRLADVSVGKRRLVDDQAFAMPPASAAAGEAEFCRLRAWAETDRADEASHPAARAAHLELAVLYRRRMMALVPERADGVEGWESEGGSCLVGE